MTEPEALSQIAQAINALAAAVAALATPLWLGLLFKNMSGDNKSALKQIAEAIRPGSTKNSD